MQQYYVKNNIERKIKESQRYKENGMNSRK